MHSEIEQNIEICSVNIEEFDKYKRDGEFAEYLSLFDIFGMCETWAISETDFDGFLYDYRHFNHVRRKSPRASRNSGE